jgi:hypothetical protein
MTARPQLLTRRAVLGGGLAVTATALGCTEQQPVADERALRAAADDERTLLAAYDAALHAGPADARLLRAIRTDHAAHLQALRHALGQPESRESTRPPRNRTAQPSALPRRERTVAANRMAAAEHARDPAHAQLLASIGASERGHSEALHSTAAAGR